MLYMPPFFETSTHFSLTAAVNKDSVDVSKKKETAYNIMALVYKLHNLNDSFWRPVH